MPENCFICQKHKGTIHTAGEVIYEDEFVYAGHVHQDGEECYLCHVMIDLKRHVPTMAEMTLEEAAAFGILMSRVSKTLKESENAEHIYAVVSGNSVPHLHMYLIARYPDTPQEFWSPFAVHDAPNARRGNNKKSRRSLYEVKKFTWR